MMISYTKRLLESHTAEEENNIISEAFSHYMKIINDSFNGQPSTDYPFIVGSLLAYLETIKHVEPIAYELGKKIYEDNKRNFTAIIINSKR